MATTTRARPSLESGDHLTREEFRRRYSERPDIKKAELVEGVVYLASPIRFDQHAEKHDLIVFWLHGYAMQQAGVRAGDNGTVYLDGRNEVQPDAFLWREGVGDARLTEDGYIDGAPQPVVEVAASCISYDLHEKMEAYRRNGVREYVVWRVLDRAVDWFERRHGAYVRRKPDADGTIKSVQFAGLRLHVPSLLAGDAAGVLAAVRPNGASGTSREAT